MTPEHRTSLDIAEETLLTAPAVARPGRMPTPTDERPAVVHPFVRRFGAGADAGRIESTVAERAAHDEPAGEPPEPWEAAARTEEEEIVEIATLLVTEEAVDDLELATADEAAAFELPGSDLEENEFTYGEPAERDVEEGEAAEGDLTEGDLTEGDVEHAPIGEIGPLGSLLPPVEADTAPGPVGAASSDRAWLETLDWDGDLAAVTGVSDEADTVAESSHGGAAGTDAADDRAEPSEQQDDEGAMWLSGGSDDQPEYAVVGGSGEEPGFAAIEHAEQSPDPDSGAWSGEHASAADAADEGVTEIADLLVAHEDEDPGVSDGEGPGEREPGATAAAADDPARNTEPGHRTADAEPQAGFPAGAAADQGAEAAIRSSLAEASAAMARAPGAMPEAFSGVFDEVADRLDNIADSMRRRSRGEAAPSRGSDPLELLLTGFVLGYVSRQGSEPRPPSE